MYLNHLDMGTSTSAAQFGTRCCCVSDVRNKIYILVKSTTKSLKETICFLWYPHENPVGIY